MKKNQKGIPNVWETERCHKPCTDAPSLPERVLTTAACHICSRWPPVALLGFSSALCALVPYPCVTAQV